MPPTVGEHNDLPQSGNPEYSTPSYFRACAEEDHFERQRKDFSLPFRIYPASTDAERRLDFRDYGNRSVARRFWQLNPDDCRAFSWKDCAIYGNAGVTTADHFTLLDKVYREWFPHRAEDKDMSDGSFFGKFMRFMPPVEKLEEILRFHHSLCEKLQSLEKDIEDKPFPYEVRPNPIRRVGAYQLRETFSFVFIVLDRVWQVHGVLLVWNSEGVAKRYNCTDGPGVTRYDCRDAGDLGEACVFRCHSLERAMQIVVSQDPQRAQKRTEYNELLEETLGDQDEK